MPGPGELPTEPTEPAAPAVPAVPAAPAAAPAVPAAAPAAPAVPAAPAAPGARRRAGRRAGGTGSRERILAVARRAFPANGYEGTSLRGIARDAGVDPSLIVQYFGSKAALFVTVVEWPFDAGVVAAEVQDVPPSEVGYYMARAFLGHWDRDEERNPIISLIYAALADPAAA
ncbi:MAG TPA: TetR/AcrR family transcriptional regulator, partial [Solirubrobacteraceae bacterium]|nr:TetR/AcrR family transcriptional regulator [Solirubrobacteraceae bacterium]